MRTGTSEVTGKGTRPGCASLEQKRKLPASLTSRGSFPSPHGSPAQEQVHLSGAPTAPCPPLSHRLPLLCVNDLPGVRPPAGPQVSLGCFFFFFHDVLRDLWGPGQSMDSKTGEGRGGRDPLENESRVCS